MDLSFITNIVSNTEQVDFLASLKDRFEYWNSPGKIDEFYNNLIHNSKDDFAYESFKDGFVIITAQSISYDDLLTGECHRLDHFWDDRSNDNFVKLSNYSGFRTEQVSERRVVTLNDSSWMYTKYVSPNNEYGTSIMTNVSDPADLTRLFIDQGAALISAVKEIGNGTAPRLMLSSANWWKDSKGWYWANLQDWTSTVEEEKATGLLYLKMMLDITASAKKITSEQATELVNYAKSKWV